MEAKETYKELARKYFKCLLSVGGKESFLEEQAHLMFVAHTQLGLPADIALDEIEKKIKISNDERVVIVAKFLNFFTEHRLLSGIGGKRLEGIQKTNRRILLNTIDKGLFEMS